MKVLNSLTGLAKHLFIYSGRSGSVLGAGDRAVTQTEIRYPTIKTKLQTAVRILKEFKRQIISLRFQCMKQKTNKTKYFKL